MAKAAVQSTIRLDPELYERAKRLADDAKVPLNACFIQAVQDWVAKAEAEAARKARRDGR